MPRIPLLALLFHAPIAALTFPCASAVGQDVEAPSQALPTDPAPPTPIGAATVDPVGLAFGEWTARLEVAPLAAHAFFVDAGYRDAALSGGITVELGYHLYPLSDGVEGPFIGPSVGAAITLDRAELSAFLAIEAGWQLLLGPFALGLSGGAEVHAAFAQDVAVVPAPRVSCSLGYALR